MTKPFDSETPAEKVRYRPTGSTRRVHRLMSRLERRPPTPGQLADIEIRYKQRIVGIVTLMLALVSGVWTFEGAYTLTERIGGESFRTIIVSGLIALAVTSAQVTAWWVLLSVVPRLKPGRKKLGISLVAALQIWTLAVSSTNNVVALTGESSLIAALQEQRAEYVHAVEAATARALAVKPYLGILKGESDGRCAQLVSEVERGSMTGARGTGSVSATLELLCAQSRSNYSQIADAVETTERRALEIQATLAAMSETLYDTSIPVFERETAFLQLTADADGWLRQTKADDMGRVLRTSHKAMAASVAALPAEQTALGVRQAAVIAGLKQSVLETGRLYSRVADELDALSEAAETPAATRVPIVFATVRAAPEHLPNVAAAIGVDLFTLFMTLAFMLARDTTRPAASTPSRTRKPKLSMKDE